MKDEELGFFSKYKLKTAIEKHYKRCYDALVISEYNCKDRSRSWKTLFTMFSVSLFIWRC